MNKSSDSPRDVTIDVLKGIGILCVIIGHLGILPSWGVQFIYSFHMPLFFIVSGYLYKPRGIKESLIKDFKHLMIPYFATCAAILFFYLLYWLYLGNSSYLHYYFIASLVGKGDEYHICKWLSTLPSIGAIWFFPALLVCKNTYNAIPNNKRLLYSALIFICATLIGRFVLFIPFSVLSGLSAIIFYAIGDKLKTVRQIPIYYWIIGGLCWLISFAFSHILLYHPRVDFYFIDVAGATTMTLIFYLLSKQLYRIKYIRTLLSLLGRYSLFILCFHLIDLDCHLAKHINITRLLPVTQLIGLVLPVLLTFVFVQLSRIVSVKKVLP